MKFILGTNVKAFPVMPGVPAAGHVTIGGAWHPGRMNNCVKCHPRDPKEKRT